MEYKILWEKSPSKLENLVQSWLNAGWKPQGGISVDNAPGAGTSYYQAIIKED